VIVDRQDFHCKQVLGMDSLVVRDDDGLTRPFQVMSKGLDSPSVLR
jgi:hypothetical protein